MPHYRFEAFARSDYRGDCHRSYRLALAGADPDTGADARLRGQADCDIAYDHVFGFMDGSGDPSLYAGYFYAFSAYRQVVFYAVC